MSGLPKETALVQSFLLSIGHALKEVRTTLPRPIVKYEKEISNEIAYADDVDFIGQD